MARTSRTTGTRKRKNHSFCCFFPAYLSSSAREARAAFCLRPSLISRQFSQSNSAARLRMRSTRPMSPRASSHHLEQCVGHIGRSGRNADACFFEGADLGRGGAFSPTHNRAGMAHATSGRSGGPGDKPRDRFLSVLENPFGCFFLRAASDFPDHDDPMRLGVLHEQFYDIEMRGAIDWVAANAHAGALADATTSELPHCFISEGATAGDNADVAFLMDVTRSFSNPAAAIGIFAFPRRDHPGAVRS